MNLNVKMKRRFKISTTNSKNNLPIVPNRINRDLLEVQSISRKGDCWDNAIAESFFHSLKTELTYHETFYNRQRLYSTTNYMSPSDYEEKILQLKQFS